MLHVEMSKIWTKGLIQVYTDSVSKYDPVSNSLTKLGEHLKIDDGIRRRVDENGVRVNEYHTRKVDLVYNDSLSIDELKVGQEYGIYLRLEDAVIPYRLTGVDLESGHSRNALRSTNYLPFTTRELVMLVLRRLLLRASS